MPLVLDEEEGLFLDALPPALRRNRLGDINFKDFPFAVLIRINPKLDEEELIKTLLHELEHYYVSRSILSILLEEFRSGKLKKLKPIKESILEKALSDAFSDEK